MSHQTNLSVFCQDAHNLCQAGRTCRQQAALCGLQVQAEASIPDQLRFYCPNPRCSAPFVLEGEPGRDSPIFCPTCSTKLCAWCRTIWHKGFGCQEYQVCCCTSFDSAMTLW